MTDSEPTTALGPVRFERTMTIDSTFAGQMTNATFRYIFLMPSRAILFGGIFLIATIGISVTIAEGSPIAVGLTTAVIVFVLAAIYFLLYLFAFLAARKHLRKRFPLGSEYSITLTDEVIRLKDSLVTGEISYKFYENVHVLKNVVGLNQAAGRVPTLLPRELFTCESLAWLTSRVQRAKLPPNTT